ncbi:MAG: hypothetical protein JNN05_09050, partial [Candidatus Omnitrophica bacterium]|nr:hypothetical protein [Candidatus Omnitrophota bacterium]
MNALKKLSFMVKSTTPLLLSPILLLCMLLSLFFWSYVGLTSKTLIYHDSLSYQHSGTILYKGPWTEYFTTGPNREPVYPLLISVAMRLAQTFHCDYLKIQIIFQIGIMLLTQWMTAVLLKRLEVSTWISAIAVAYLGLSPAFVNFGFILYSEIITYPLILWLALELTNTFSEVNKASFRRIAANGIRLAAAALAITFTKGIFEVIVPMLMICCCVLFLSRTSNHSLRKRLAFLFFVFLLTFQVPLAAYKQLNKIYNGNYALTNRGSYALYGNTARRMLPLDRERFVTALAFIPGPDVCAYFFKEACAPWGFLPVDILASVRFQELRKTVQTPNEFDKTIVTESLQQIFKNPFQYTLLTFIEGTKIFFWEAPEIYCVVYPKLMTQISNNPWVRYSLRFLMGLSGFISL